MVYGAAGYCVDPSFKEGDACTTLRGGHYDVDKSKSRVSAVYGQYPLEDGRYPSAAMIGDTVTVNGNVSLPEIPIAIAVGADKHDNHHTMMSLGMGNNSAFLNALKDAKTIKSLTWSMFNGWVGDDAENQHDGGMVFGGYDRAKVSGDGFKIPMSAQDNKDSCLKTATCCESRLKVTISDLVLNFPDGSNSSLLANAEDSIIACITPDYPNVFSMGQNPYFKRFEDLTNVSLSQQSEGLSMGAMRYSSRNTPYDGDLTIKIKSGPSIRIPNHQLVQKERIIDKKTGNITTNGSNKIVALEKLPTRSGITPQLGMLFLSSAYIMVNQDADEFTLWPAEQRDAVDLVAVGTDNAESTNFCDSPQSPKDDSDNDGKGGNGGNEGEAEGSEDRGKKSQLSKGAVAGVACGSIAAIAIICLLGVFLVRQRRRNTRNRRESIDSPPPPPPPKGPELDGFSPTYSQGGWQQPVITAMRPINASYEDYKEEYPNELPTNRSDPHGLRTELQGNGGQPGRQHVELAG